MRASRAYLPLCVAAVLSHVVLVAARGNRGGGGGGGRGGGRGGSSGRGGGNGNNKPEPLPPLPELMAIDVAIDTRRPLHTVDEAFLSFTLDGATAFLPGTPWHKVNTDSRRLNSLLSGLEPAILRIGGTFSSYVVFNKSQRKLDAVQLTPGMHSMSPKQWDYFVKLTRDNGLRLLFGLNAQLRYGHVWNPMNAIQLLQYSERNGYGDHIDWEMGSEPTTYEQLDFAALSPAQVARGFVSLRRLLNTFPDQVSSRVVGPGLADLSKDGKALMKQYINDAGDSVDAVTFHHYYLSGSGRWEDHVNKKLFDGLQTSIDKVKATVAKSKRKDIPIWMNEGAGSRTSPSDATEAYVSGFLWMDKLGLSARNGVAVVVRQTFFGPSSSLVDFDLNPNPDYWLSWLHKRLVGSVVLDVRLRGSDGTARAYAHCTCRRAGDGVYKKGAVTIFALNVHQINTQTLTLDRALMNQKVKVFHLTPDGLEGMVSRHVALNGRRLEMTARGDLPELTAVTETLSTGIKLPPLTYGFYVLPWAGAGACA